MRVAAAVVFCVLLGACAAVPSARSGSGDVPASRSAPGVNLSGYNAAFKDGYADGCDSARGTQRRNAKRYGGETDYMMGWNDGHALCARR